MDTDLIRPLQLAENNFLQVLLYRFVMTRHEHHNGVELIVHFDQNSPTIWLREAKNYLLRNSEDFWEKAKAYQENLDAFLLEGKGPQFSYDDPKFPFRYASGGTLPIIRMNGKDYFCLFYRETHPVGWNIANGGCYSSEELLNPLITIKRELGEELIIIDPQSKSHFVFEVDEGKPIDHPDFAAAWQRWQPRFIELGYLPLEELQIPLKWIDGMDTLTVRYGKYSAPKLEGIFLNITASDFGIEIDRISKISISKDAILCDGEIINSKLLKRPVALFEVDSLNRAIKAEATDFIPNLIYFDAVSYDGGEMRSVVKMFLDHLKREEIRTPQELEYYEKVENKFDLCPISKRIIMRCPSLDEGALPEPVDSGRPCDVFISFASEDRDLARSVYDYLRNNASKYLFFSDQTLHHPDFGRSIDDALEVATTLVVVGSNVEHLKKPWVDYEWRSFHQDILSRGLSRERKLLSFIRGIHPLDLPRPLRFNKCIECQPDDMKRSLENLIKIIR